MNSDQSTGDSWNEESAGEVITHATARAIPVVAVASDREGPVQPSLTDLLAAAEPLMRMYMEGEKEKHAKSIELEKEIVATNGKIGRWMLAGIFGLSAVVLVFAGALFLMNRADDGIELIQLVATVFGAGLGGYGIAKSRMTNITEE